ncbi:MAG: hypothetical protein U0791_13690 [Gemmataceae bacterium]
MFPLLHGERMFIAKKAARGATVLALRRPVTVLGSAKSKASNISGKALRNTGRYTLRQVAMCLKP